jgi:hypothetical protein
MLFHRLSLLLTRGLPLLLIAWLGSARGEAPAKPAAAKTSKTTTPATVSDAERRAATLASFTGGVISVGDMEDAIAKQVPSTRRALAPTQARREFLERLVRYELLVHEAERLGYAEHLLVSEAAKHAAIDQLTEHTLAVAPESISKEDVAQYYEQHKRELSRPLIRRASQIELASEAEARATIAALKGADRLRFAELARERSQDPRTARQGGELGYFDREGNADTGATRAPIPPALIEAVFALKHVGDISSAPVHHERGFSVLMLTGEMPAMVKSLAKASDDIRELLAQQRKAQNLDAVLEKLRAQYPPETHPELLAPIAIEPGKPLDIPEGFPAAPPDPHAPPRIVKPDKY